MSLHAPAGPPVTVRVPAKINLDLVVGPRRPDGFHDLSTVFHAVSLYDEVTVSHSDDWSVSVSGPYADLVPTDESNLALRAGRLLADRGLAGGADQTGVHIHIDKMIPVAGGLAGGSADAAGTLVACDALWGLDAERGELDACAALLGSDVTFALQGGTAIGSGRGELIAPVLSRGRYHWVLVASDEGLSTPAVYAEIDRLRGDDPVPTPEPSPDMMAALRSGDVIALGLNLRNDLAAAAYSLRPDLREVVDAGLEYGAMGAIVFGSGPTVAFLVSGAEGSLDLAVALMASGTVSHVLRANGPVHGAHVVSVARAEQARGD